MAAYIIGHIDITDPEQYKEYAAQVPAVVAKYDGEYLVRGGELTVLEGEVALPRTVVLKFPSVERARQWYDSEDYAGPKAIRRAASFGSLMIVEGV